MDNITFMNDSCSSLEINALFVVNTVLLFGLALASFAISITLFQLIWRRFLFHANVRLIFLHFSAANAATSLFTIFRVTYNFCIVIFGIQSFLSSRGLCAAIDSIGSVPLTVSCTSIGCVGFERCVATIRKNVSDPVNSCKFMKCICIALWFSAIINCGFVVLDAYQFGDETICYCALGLTQSPKSLFNIIQCYFCFDIVYLVCYIYVYKANKKDMEWSINTAKHNLHERYQKWNNIELSKSLLPNVFSNSILYNAVVISYYFIHPYYWKEQNINSVNVLMFAIITTTFINFLQPFLFITCNNKLKKAAIKEYAILQYFTNKRYSNKAGDAVVDVTELETASCLNTNDLNIVSYQVKPEESQMILDNIWEKRCTR